jgi:hypothetical protein
LENVELLWHHRFQGKVTIPQPTRLSKQRPALRALAIGLACLGMCVFAWGLRYKLSLYDPPGASAHHMPAAKLLTGNERRAVSVADLPPVSGLPALTLFTALVFSVLLLKHPRIIPGFGSSRLIPVRCHAVTAQAHGAVNFIRPPPRFR